MKFLNCSSSVERARPDYRGVQYFPQHQHCFWSAFLLQIDQKCGEKCGEWGHSHTKKTKAVGRGSGACDDESGGERERERERERGSDENGKATN